MKEELCKAFCQDLEAVKVPAGLAVGTGFQKSDGDHIGFYIIGPDASGQYRVQDDGLGGALRTHGFWRDPGGPPAAGGHPRHALRDGDLWVGSGERVEWGGGGWVIDINLFIVKLMIIEGLLGSKKLSQSPHWWAT